MSQKCPYDVAFSTQGKPVLLYCGKWSCPHCAKLNARMWSWRVRIHVEDRGGEWWFITFTLARSIVSVAMGYKLLPRIWDTMRKAMQRFYKGQKWEYVAFVEGQPKRYGMPHFHIISNRRTPFRDKDFAVSVGFGHQAKTSLVTSDKAAAYISKYASKMDKRQPKNLRHVRPSQGWAKLPTRDYPAYIVRSRKETHSAYIMRVSDLTGRDMQDLSDEYIRFARKLERYDIELDQKAIDYDNPF